ncbi:MAG: hypothetical protein HY865_27090 [Chloroflexi bacterium]|nr:hypothetical protein [Chloroflexota bacterium]
MTNNPNIRFAYMYRDAGNYKQHGEAVFGNKDILPVEDIETQIRSLLQDGEFFIARQVQIVERFFDDLHDDDHPWHEFVSVTVATDPVFDPDRRREIAEFIADLEKSHRAGWDEAQVRADLAQLLAGQKRALKQKIESDVKSKLENGDENEHCVPCACPAGRKHHPAQGITGQSSYWVRGYPDPA